MPTTKGALEGASQATASASSAWVEPLKNEPEANLQAFGAPLEAAVAVRRTAEREVKAAAKALTDFRLIGERKRAVDALNAA